MQDKYMAYVGSYSYNGQAKGITVYDVDEKKGKFIYRCEVEVDNSSYLTVSHDGRMLYSIADEAAILRPMRRTSLSSYPAIMTARRRWSA